MGVLHDIHAGADGWIRSADAKASTIITMVSLLLAVDAFVGAPGGPIGHGPLHLAFVASALGAAGCSIAVVWPRTNRAKLLGKKPGMMPSMTFFGDVARMSFSEFAVGLSDEGVEDKLKADRIEQAYVVARVAAGKMRWVRRSIAALVVALVTLALLAFAAVGSP